MKNEKHSNVGKGLGLLKFTRVLIEQQKMLSVKQATDWGEAKFNLQPHGF